MSNEEIYEHFTKEYQNREDKIRVESYNVQNKKDETQITIVFDVEDKTLQKTAIGNGPIDATISILKNIGYDFEFKNYIQQSSKDNKEKSTAITYINIVKNGKNIWAVGKDEDVIKSSLLGIVSAINRF